MDYFSQMQTLEQWYYHVGVDDVLEVFERSSKKRAKSAAKMVKKASTRTQEQTLDKLTTLDGDRRRINYDPPLLVPVREMGLEKHYDKDELKKFSKKTLESSWSQYLESLPDERRYLLERYTIVDAALRVGGIGSVGTRCLILLLKGGAENDNLILQLKEAGPSVLEAYLDTHSFENNAKRVVTAQRLMQATSDIFLGWHKSPFFERDYYWRQLKDMKGSADIAGLDEKGLGTYLAVCSWCLARAHARTGDEVQISGYLGSSDAFAEAVADFSMAYADQVELDYQALVEAVKSGRITAETGI